MSPRLAPVEGAGEDSAAGFQAQIVQAARDRAGAWEAAAVVLDPPAPKTAESLRAGEVATAWRLAARWLDADAELFATDLMTLDVYARAARRRPLDQDLAGLRDDHEAFLAPAGDLAGPARRAAGLCREEAEAWARGDAGGARRLRRQERAHLEATLVPTLPEACAALATHARTTVWRTLARLLLAILSVESGTDHHRAVRGDAPT